MIIGEILSSQCGHGGEGHIAAKASAVAFGRVWLPIFCGSLAITWLAACMTVRVRVRDQIWFENKASQRARQTHSS